ncbi:helix-turn-helix domain-containing protein [Polynucleobacter sp. 86C-FISCH]|nr:helix-turn-helix domain-containing protein [Polynucleobacter sp. 86C-FISCH]
MDPLNKAIEYVGNAGALASKLKVVPSTIANWKARTGMVPPKYCAKIEQITGGAITRQDLRPNDWLEYWPDLPRQTRIVCLDDLPDDLKSMHPLLKNCGRFEDDHAIYAFLLLPPDLRTQVFNTTPFNILISEVMCLKLRAHPSGTSA